MEPLTEAQLAVLRRKVGDQPDDAGLQAIYDRTMSLTETAKEIVETRIATLLASPASYNVQGEYSQDTSTNIKELENMLAWIGDLDSPETDDDSEQVAIVEIFEPARPRYMR